MFLVLEINQIYSSVEMMWISFFSFLSAPSLSSCQQVISAGKCVILACVTRVKKPPISQFVVVSNALKKIKAGMMLACVLPNEHVFLLCINLKVRLFVALLKVGLFFFNFFAFLCDLSLKSFINGKKNWKKNRLQF